MHNFTQLASRICPAALSMLLFLPAAAFSHTEVVTAHTQATGKRGAQFCCDNSGTLTAHHARQQSGTFPLRHTKVVAEISRDTARIPNPYDDPLFSCALPESGSVYEIEGRNGGKRINARLRPSSEDRLGIDYYYSIHSWFNDDPIGNLLSSIGQLIGKWYSELVNGWIADTALYLGAILMASFSRSVDLVRSEHFLTGANDSWMEWLFQNLWCCALGLAGIPVIRATRFRRLNQICTLPICLAVALLFQLTVLVEINCMDGLITMIFALPANQLADFGAALSSALKGGSLVGVVDLAAAVEPVLGGSNAWGDAIRELFAFIGLVIFMCLAILLLFQLARAVVTFSLQTLLLFTSFMLAPLAFLALCSTHNRHFATTFIRMWLEISAWSLPFMLLLKATTMVLFSDINPWTKVFLAVALLDLLNRVPALVARLKISPLWHYMNTAVFEMPTSIGEIALLVPCIPA